MTEEIQITIEDTILTQTFIFSGMAHTAHLFINSDRASKDAIISDLKSGLIDKDDLYLKMMPLFLWEFIDFEKIESEKGVFIQPSDYYILYELWQEVIKLNLKNVLSFNRKLGWDAIEKYSAKERKENYQLYLKSPHWQRIKSIALINAFYQCELCYSPENLQVHHNTYERLHSELQADLDVLCKDCHAKKHPRKGRK